MKNPNQPVIVAGLRTPFLDSGGAYAPLMTYQLAAESLSAVVERTGVDTGSIGLVTMGTVLHEIETSNVAREAMLTAGLPANIPAYTTSMAGLSASVGFANLCDMIALGRIQAGLAGGVESFSDIPIRYAQPVRRAAMKLRQDSSARNVLSVLSGFRPKDLLPEMPKGTDFTTKMTMGQCTEKMVRKFKVSREACDDFTVRSHRLAIAAQKAGYFNDMVSPVVLKQSGVTVTDDNTPRASCTAESVARLKPIFDRQQGVVTAAGSSRFTDGSAALLVMSAQAAKAQGLVPMAEVVDYQLAAVNDLNSEMLLGPAVSIPALLKRNGLRMSDIDVWELHEAFAAQILVNRACLADPRYADEYHGGDAPGELPIDRLNTWGGSLALGNPFAATGIRLLTTAAHRLNRESGRWAVVSSCAGGGLGAAILLRIPG
ncbi:MAG: thiolase family protein [Limnobacter sp.]|uniref:thiolase family protein n=1 Tax=Limnobacter sp. TaxID=2003368 RepID=UPI00391A5EBB